MEWYHYVLIVLAVIAGGIGGIWLAMWAFIEALCNNRK